MSAFWIALVFILIVGGAYNIGFIMGLEHNWRKHQEVMRRNGMATTSYTLWDGYKDTARDTVRGISRVIRRGRDLVRRNGNNGMD